MHNIFELCCEGYDGRLEHQFLKPNKAKKKVYICSPYSDPDHEKQLENMRRARLYMLYANEHMGYLARAPHAYLPMLVCDRVPAERAMALRFGLELLEKSDLLLVCGTVLSKGMKGEITHAAKLGIPIKVFDDDLYVQTRKLVTKAGAGKQLVTLDRQHTVLGLGEALIVPEEGGGPDA